MALAVMRVRCKRSGWLEGGAEWFRISALSHSRGSEYKYHLSTRDGEWKVVHRQADPITTARPAESLAEPS
jgi:1,4-alpha-glucan branching enzyme